MRRREAGDEFDRRPLSAVAFYYARGLYLALGVPIGIVNASRGGTNIDAWTPRCGYADCDVSIKATAEYFVKAPDAWTNADRWGPITNTHQQPTVFWNGMVAAYAPKSDAVAKPIAVRYMGRDRAAGTMYNEVALPLGPFECAVR